MKTPHRLLLTLAAFVLCVPGGAQATTVEPSPSLPIDAVIEKVVFDSTLTFEQGIVLALIGVKPGDVLTRDANRRITRQLGTLRVPRSFSFKAGSKRGRVVLSISAAEGC